MATIEKVSLSEKTVTPGGGSITVTGTPSADSTCSVTVTPALAELPDAVPCYGGWPVQFELDIPGNTTTLAIPYQVALTTCDGTDCQTTAPVELDEQAYEVTFKSSPLENTFVSVSCPSTTFCMAVDSSGGGHVLNAIRGKVKDVKIDPSTMRLSTVACGSPTYCIAADLDGDVGTWDGQGTEFSQQLGASGIEDAVAVFSGCAGPTDCSIDWTEGPGSSKLADGTSAVQNVRVRERNAIMDNQRFTTPGVTSGFACLLDADTCVTVDDQGFASTFDGTQTISSSLNGVVGTSITCPAADRCVATDTIGGIDDFAPLSLAREGIVHKDLATRVDSAACPTAFQCVTTSGSNLQMALWGNYAPIREHRSASAVVSPEATAASLLVVPIPGNTSQFIVLSKTQKYVGHITLNR